MPLSSKIASCDDNLDDYISKVLRRFDSAMVISYSDGEFHCKVGGISYTSPELRNAVQSACYYFMESRVRSAEEKIRSLGPEGLVDFAAQFDFKYGNKVSCTKFGKTATGNSAWDAMMNWEIDYAGDS